MCPAIYKQRLTEFVISFAFVLTGVSSLVSKMLFRILRYEDVQRLKLATLLGTMILAVIVAIIFLYLWYRSRSKVAQAWGRRRAVRYPPPFMGTRMYGIPPPPYSRNSTNERTGGRKLNPTAIRPAFVMRKCEELKKKNTKRSPMKSSEPMYSELKKDNAPPKFANGAITTNL
ncbi:Helicase SWR1 [Trichinella pseudospiralis]